MKQLVLGLGEIGGPLYALLSSHYQDVHGFDSKTGDGFPVAEYDVLHIAYPYTSGFTTAVNRTAHLVQAGLVIVHSTVPVGTTARIANGVHSPILGRHETMDQDIHAYMKWFGGPYAEQAAALFTHCNLRTRVVESSTETELLKLLCLAKYGLSIAFAHYERDLFKSLGFDFSHIIEWDADYNLNVKQRLKRPIIAPQHDAIGGHCVVPGVKLLEAFAPHKLLRGVLEYGGIQVEMPEADKPVGTA